MPEPLPASDGPLRVMVVDADDRVRESLSGLLAISGQVTVVGSAGHVGQALAIAARARPEVVIVDPRLPEVDGGLAFISRLRLVCPDTCVLAMGWADDLESAVLETGADGFLRKTFRPTELIDAILAATRRPDARADA